MTKNEQFEKWVAQFGAVGEKREEKLYKHFCAEFPKFATKAPRDRCKHTVLAAVPITVGIRRKIAHRLNNAHTLLKGKKNQDYLHDKQLLHILINEYLHSIKILEAIKDLYDLEKQSTGSKDDKQN